MNKFNGHPTWAIGRGRSKVPYAVPSGGVLDLRAFDGKLVHVNTTAVVTAILAPPNGECMVVFDTACTLTYSASLQLPGAANITATAGDCMQVVDEEGIGARVFSYMGLATLAEVKTGTNSAKVVAPAALLSALGFSAYFQTADQVITNGGLLTIAHGLGRAPVLLHGFLKNVTAEMGYSIGDITPVNLGADSASAAKGVAVTSDATNIFVRYSNGGGSSNTFFVADKSTGGVSPITNANWSFFLRVLA